MSHFFNYYSSVDTEDKRSLFIDEPTFHLIKDFLEISFSLKLK